MVDRTPQRESKQDRKTAIKPIANDASTKTRTQAKRKKKQTSEAPRQEKPIDAPTSSQELPSPPVAEQRAELGQGIDDRDDRIAQLERELHEREYELRRHMRTIAELEGELQDTRKRYLIGMVESKQDVEILLRDIQTPPNTDTLAWLRDRLDTLMIRLTDRVEQEIEDLEFAEMIVSPGDRFDPHQHAALPESAIDTPDGSGIRVVDQVVHKGYLYNGKVAKGKVALYPIVKIGRRGA